MSSSRPSSPVTASSANPQLPVKISTNPNSPAYAPDMDNLRTVYYARLRDNFGDGKFLVYRCFTYKGDGGNVTMRVVFLLYNSELRELSQNLKFAPWIPCGFEHNVLRGLSRRIYGSYYDTWFTLPLVSVDVENLVLPFQELNSIPIKLSKELSHLYEDEGMFYLSFDTKTRQVRIICSESISASGKLASVCKKAEELGVRDNPLTLVTCALSSVLQTQGWNAHAFSSFASKMEDYGNSLKFEIAEDEETKVKETAIQLRKSLPYMEKILETADCMIQIIEDTISEHNDWKKILPIPDSSDQHFLRVEKNLQTLRSQAISFKIYQNARIRRINVCLSTLSSLLSLRADSAIKASTEAMTRLTEANREDSGKMNDIAIATKLDSEAMITIAKLTMLYLPPTFIATLFSMGIFNFDFDNGKNGRLVMSSQWWIYVIFAIPLTLGTFYWFRAVTRSHKQASKKAEREAKQPE
ncbi:hypothetical protein FGADI_11309 [Fusarium gaditjirri]|uniref:Uncharacterized protein n=1 Tax=Fusarium gaditjirri TaxID=282569 RepID=A0A8H4SVB2_9HYPO|nr:hypothetical protein FGADI_11309 [Fusarium gaditjirri]